MKAKLYLSDTAHTSLAKGEMIYGFQSSVVFESDPNWHKSAVVGPAVAEFEVSIPSRADSVAIALGVLQKQEDHLRETAMKALADLQAARESLLALAYTNQEIL